MSWDKFQEGASKGFDEYLEVVRGNKDMDEAMSDIKDYFENDTDKND
jgi:hypothetical protein